MAVPISLYIALEQDRKVDLEVVARASLAFARAVRAAVTMHDPFADVRIELIDAPEGSISLNAVVKWLKDKTGVQDEVTLKVVVLSLGIWFAKETAGWGLSKVLDYIAEQGAQQTLNISDADVQRIAERVVLTLKSKVSQPQVQEVYRELERDSAIAGVGASLAPNQKPKAIVPRSEFRERSGVIQKQDLLSTDKRKSTSPEKVRLISPVLLESARRWRFAGSMGEFGAPIKDQNFLHNLLTGKIRLPMVGGIELDVILEVVEEHRDGVWVVVERNVLEVTHVYPPVTQQQSLFAEPPQLDSDNDKDKAP